MSTTLTDRCPGCGSVVVEPGENRAGCHAVNVDRSEPGYAYLADTWGYCYNESRHVALSEKPWLAARLAEARTQAVLDYLENAQPHIIQEAETAGARKVRKRVEAVLRERCDSMSRSTYDVHGGWVHMESVRAALVEGEVGV